MSPESGIAMAGNRGNLGAFGGEGEEKREEEKKGRVSAHPWYVII
jgi:hypothetical protein